jgi:protein SCO1/2
MTTELTKVQNAINKSAPFRIVSYSLDPDNDSVPVLKSFANKFHAIDSIWYFLTGPKEEIYELGKDGYLQTVLDDSASFVNHTQKLILVDKNGMIRGFYNALDSIEIQLLIRDINYLIYKTDDKSTES